MRYKNRSEASASHCPRTAGRRDHREFGGSRGGDQVRITATLIEGASGEVIWAHSFERDLRDVMALQREVARAISSRVDVTLTPQAEAHLAITRPSRSCSVLAGLLGRHHTAKATEDGLRRAVQYFELALAKAADNAMAHAGLANAYIGLSGDYLPPREAMPKAKQAAEIAIRLDEGLADAHAALGFIHLVDPLGRPCGKAGAASQRSS